MKKKVLFILFILLAQSHAFSRVRYFGSKEINQAQAVNQQPEEQQIQQLEEEKEQQIQKPEEGGGQLIEQFKQEKDQLIEQFKQEKDLTVEQLIEQIQEEGGKLKQLFKEEKKQLRQWIIRLYTSMKNHEKSKTNNQDSENLEKSTEIIKKLAEQLHSVVP